MDDALAGASADLRRLIRDGTIFKGPHLVAVIAIDVFWEKIVPGTTEKRKGGQRPGSIN